MTLRWNDAAATVLVLVAMSLFVTDPHTAAADIVNDPRILTALLGLVGVASCAANNPDIKYLRNDRLAPVLGGIGTLGLLVMSWGIIWGNPLAPLVLLGIIIGLWVVTTTRHATGTILEEVHLWQKAHAPKNLKSAVSRSLAK